MNKLTDIAILNRSAENTATVHMRDRYGQGEKTAIIKIFTFFE
jgi:hypothetical protein